MGLLEAFPGAGHAFRGHVGCLAPDLSGYHRAMADAATLTDRLEQIGAQLDWVRDYL